MKVVFSHTSRRLPIATFAVAKTDERPIDAVRRSIERTTGLDVYSCRCESWEQDRAGNRIGETYSMTLTGREKIPGGGRPIAAEIRVYI